MFEAILLIVQIILICGGFGYTLHMVRQKTPIKLNEDKLANTVVDVLSELSNNEETQKAVGNFIQVQVVEAFNSIQPQIEEQLGEAMGPQREEAEAMVSEMAAGAIKELLPMEMQFLLSNINPDWEEESKENPQKYLLIYQGAQKVGLIDLLDGILGKVGLGESTTSTARATNEPSQPSTKSSWE